MTPSKSIRHEVEVADACFLYDGERCKSLSEIAGIITGTRWNGPTSSACGMQVCCRAA